MNYFKNIYLTLILFTCSTIAHSQSTENYFEWGIKGGLNLSQITDYDSRIKPHFHVGLFDEWALTEKLVLRSEILFSVQGENKKGNNSEVTLLYVNTPILAKFYITPRWGISSGLQFDYLAKQKGISINTDKGKRYGFSAIVEGSYRITKKIDLGVRYNLGLSKLDTNQKEDKLYNEVIQLGASISF